MTTLRDRWRRLALASHGRAGEVFLSAAILLITLGTVMVFSASFFHQSVGGDPYLFLRRQFEWLPIAALFGAAAWRIDYRELARRHLWVFGIAALLLGLVLVPGIGTRVNGAQRWIRFGSSQLQFQPSELAKLAVVIFIAGFLARGPDRVRSFWKGLAPLGAGIFLLVGLILIEPDFGTALFVLLLAAVVILIAGVPKRYAILSGLVAAPPLILFMQWRWEQIRPRLMAFIEPESIYQVKQSLIGLAAGGILGTGLGAGGQKLKNLPEPQTDFIFTVVGEELGLVGSVAVIALFLCLLASGALVAWRARDRFGFLLASGIVISLTLQAAINIAVVTASAPTKGIPLPFLTFGRSGLVMTLIEVGLLLSVDRMSRAALAATEGAASLASEAATLASEGASAAPPAFAAGGRVA